MDTPHSDTPHDPLSGDGDQPENGGERIAKRLARAGLCSRRDAERWIAEGRVAVNGRTLDSPACVVTPGDIVLVDGKPIPEPEPTRLWRYHKPAGLVTTARDEKGRSTVFEKLPSDMPRVVSVGRLDLNTEGLLLLTNDGELARFLELPVTGWTRRYRVRVHGTVDERKLAGLAKGLTIEGVTYGPIEAALDRVQGSNAWLTVGLKEGKNREIRKVMETLDLQVTRLIRTAYGPFQLGKLEEGLVEEVPKRVVKDQVTGFFRSRDGVEATEAPSGHAKAAVRKTGPARASHGRPQEKPSHAKPSPIRSAPDRPGDTKAAEERPARGKPFQDRPAHAKAAEDRPARGKPFEDRPARGKVTEDRPARGKASEDRPARGKATEDRPARGKTSPDRPAHGKPSQERSAQGRPAQAKPAPGKPGPGKPHAAKPAGRGADAKGMGAKGTGPQGPGAKGTGGRGPGGKPAGGRDGGRADRRR